MEKAPLARCDQCPLQDRPFVPSLLRRDASIIIVGEAPGSLEVQLGQPFVGPSGQLLDRLISSVGGMPESTTRMNVVCCRPPDNRTPSSDEIACCRPRLLAEIRSCPGAVVLALGATAGEQLIGPDASVGTFYSGTDGGVPELAGKKLIHTWHPAYVLRKPSALTELKKNLGLVFTPGAAQANVLPEIEVVVLNTADDVESAVDYLQSHEEFAFDFETNQINWQRNAVMCLALACEPERAFVLTDEVLYDDKRALSYLHILFGNKDLRSIAHHGKFDLHFLWHQFGITEARDDFDTLMAHYALVEVYPHDLKTLLSWYFGYPNYESQLVSKYLTKKSDDYSKIPPESLYLYASHDVTGTLRLKRRLAPELTALQLMEWPFEKILMPATMALCHLEHRGMAVDVPFLMAWGQRMASEMDRLTIDLRGKAGSGHDDLNPNAWGQLAEILWNEMKLPVNRQCRSNIERAKKGKSPISTAEDALDHLGSINKKSGRKVRDGNPFVDTLIEYRRVAKLKNTYVDNLLEASERSTDGRVHATANVHGTEVGRLSFNDPPLQTIPREADLYGKVIRSSFMAEPGSVLIILDYSQAEFRVFAAESGDPNLLQAYKDGRDIHDEVARGLYGEGFTKEQRVMAKMWDFAWIYGGSAHSFAQDAGMPLNKAQEWVGTFNGRFPVAVEWKRQTFLNAKSNGYVKTRTGRYRRFPLITSQNIEEVRKGSVHAVIAGGASDMALLSLIECEQRGFRPVLTVHDSIILEEREQVAEAVAETAKQIMLDIASHWYPEVPWKVDVDVQRTWVEQPVLSPSEAELTSNESS